ncbi:putative receptor-like protein kinase [Dorcoceras hygrometricum]|uniref:Putative receptor-like protein kinase n=1 Tax=Dorcoceras hygrometricum TaxID=472368 RepID=A0A2Z7BVZ6_9LAMI|nr:putative receptor-like protein kinase [Dorcoceras hygrometricum]
MKKAAEALSVDVISSDITISRKIYQQRASTSRVNLELAIAKRCRLHKLIRQRFAFVLKIQQMLFALITSSRKISVGSYIVGSPSASISLPPAGRPDASNSTSSLDMESSRKKADVKESYNPDARYPVAVFEASAVAQSIQSTKKQLLREVL